MLYNLLYPLADQYSIFNLFQYITFRSAYALVTSLVICWIVGPAFIRRLRSLQGEGQPIRVDGPKSHLSKQGTPTMGGGLILLALSISTLLWADLTNPYIWLAMAVTLGFGFIGWYDDHLKLTKRDPKGLAGWKRLTAQAAISLLVSACLLQMDRPIVDIPFFKHQWDLGWWYVPFTAFVLVGCANAVNLTDGLDGLAVTPTFMVAACLSTVAYLSGHAKFSEYLLIPHVSGAGELTIFGASLIGSCLGFLWFNTYPAQVFMGDVGALSLGGALAFIASAVHQQFLLAIAGGIFVLEAVSVMLQVASYKLYGKRIFRMAPLHHHFELKGWPEPKIIVRFWIVSLLLALIALSTLKIR